MRIEYLGLKEALRIHQAQAYYRKETLDPDSKFEALTYTSFPPSRNGLSMASIWPYLTPTDDICREGGASSRPESRNRAVGFTQIPHSQKRHLSCRMSSKSWYPHDATTWIPASNNQERTLRLAECGIDRTTLTIGLPPVRRGLS